MPVRLVAAGAAVLVLAAAVVALLWVGLPDPAGLASKAPRTTALVEQRRAEARKAGRPFSPDLRLVPLEQISPRLAEAVVLAEDAGFFDHGPFDVREMQRAIEKNIDRRRWVRGASTLTQQLAKNLYLGTEKTLTRKAKEAVLALKLERSLGKRRILALYLNVAEWGEGVFGVEAAAGARFGVPASSLSTAQAAVLAAMLPAPRRADLAHPSRWLARRARRIVDRLLASGRLEPSEHAHASAELERILAGAAGPEEPPDEADPPSPGEG
jgi:monofunctional biosynthetic peptidoglycan transglycosylase